MEENLQNDSELITSNVHDDDIRSSTTDRLLEVYDQIANSDDIAYKLAALMTTSNYYSYALRISNEINGRQGKNRATIDYRSSQLMRYSFDTDVDQILDQKMVDLLVDVLNTYLADKQELPTNRPRERAGKLSRVKALMIMLTATDQYGIIPLLTLPTYILPMVTELFENIQTIKNDVLDSFIKWLEMNGNQEMADIVRQEGNAFWGSEGVKANVIYDKYFGKIREKINKPIETYDMYLKFRQEYRRSTKKILPNKIYDIFDITPSAYDRARVNIYNELNELFPEDEMIKVTQRLILE